MAGLIGFVWSIAFNPTTQAQTPSRYTAEAAPILAKYCGACHNPTKAKGGVDISRFGVEAAFSLDGKMGRQILENVEGGAMPPDDAPQIPPSELAKLVAELQSVVSKAGCVLSPDPGRVTLRRLNRVEYNNTVRDLIGVDFRPADDFPSDDVGYGFDNIGDVLSLPPMLMEKYLAAAESVSEQAILADDRPRGPSRRWRPEQYGKPGVNGQSEESGFWLMNTNAEATFDGAFPKPGNYIIRVRAVGHRAGPDLPRMEFQVDGKPFHSVAVKAEEDSPEVYEGKLRLKRGGGKLTVAFTNDAWYPDSPDTEHRDRNLSLDTIEVIGPLYQYPDHLPESHTRIIARRPGPLNHREVTRDILSKFASRAYRRPATETEVNRLVGLVEMVEKGGDKFERGIQLAVEAVLVSPNFLFRVELEQRPGQVRPLTDLELASRLSYFLWSSMPDDELLALANRKQLRVGANLDAQVARMLKDPKAFALVENFAGQWLQTRNLKLANPDEEQFPKFDEPLRQAMQREVELFFAAVLQGNRPLTDFLHADYTYLNDRLAQHYGIKGVTGESFRRVALTDRSRGGVITMASTLTVTSNPTRTSPVKRGKWILEEILGTPPPPPPPGISDLPDNEEGKKATSVRERLEKHRSNPDCASCHARMDPLGFGLENFDAVGAFRAKDGDQAIDAKGVLPSGPSFNGPVELKAVLLSKQVPFARCFTEKLMTYALGRGLEEADRCSVDQIAGRVMLGGGQIGKVVSEIVHSDAFGKTNATNNGAPR